MKACISVLLILAAPMICRGSTTAPTTNPPYHVLKHVESRFTIYDVTDKANEESTEFMNDIRNALKEIRENPVGKKALEELAGLQQKVVIIPSDFVLRWHDACNKQANSQYQYEEVQASLALISKFRSIEPEPDFQEYRGKIKEKWVNELLEKMDDIFCDYGRRLFELRSQVEKKLDDEAKKIKPLKEDLLIDGHFSEVINKLFDVLREGSCFAEPTDSIPINLIAIDRNWRNRKKLMVDKGDFLAQRRWAQIKHDVDLSAAATLFHEINHCRHFHKFGKERCHILTQMSSKSASSSLRLLKDRGETPLQGIFTNAEEELQLTGFTIDNNKNFIYDEINEVSFRLNGPFHIRFPYAEPKNPGGLYLSADECRKLLKPRG